MPQAPVSIARTMPVVTNELIDPSKSDEFETADDNINDLIGLVANNLWS